LLVALFLHRRHDDDDEMASVTTLLPSRMRAVAQAVRCFSSSASTPSPSYPYSSTARVVASPPPPAGPLTDSLMRTLNAHLTALHPAAPTYLPLFSRRSKDRLLPGSVLTVSSYTSVPSPENPTPSVNTFSGVLIAIRRRHAGRDTSFRLRNMVGKTGVEVAYKAFSPLVAAIKVVSRAANSGPPVTSKTGVEGQRKKPTLKASKRAKMYWIRDQPAR
jgi:large subunit ribosomal protein L19